MHLHKQPYNQSMLGMWMEDDTTEYRTAEELRMQYRTIEVTWWDFDWFGNPIR